MNSTAGPACVSLIEMWNSVVAQFLAGGPSAPPAIERWQSGYQGTGLGKMERNALPEPFLGPLDHPKAVFLALNPGKADVDFQSRTGIFADQIRAAGSYSAWAASWPYFCDPW